MARSNTTLGGKLLKKAAQPGRKTSAHCISTGNERRLNGHTAVPTKGQTAVDSKTLQPEQVGAGLLGATRNQFEKEAAGKESSGDAKMGSDNSFDDRLGEPKKYQKVAEHSRYLLSKIGTGLAQQLAGKEETP